VSTYRNQSANQDRGREIVESWVAGLRQVIESMTDQAPALSVEFRDRCPVELDAPETLWWEQLFSAAPDATVSVGAARAAWEHAGTQTLKAAGLDSADSDEARNTWLEILGQSLSTMARSIGGILGREITCEAGKESAPVPSDWGWGVVLFSFEGVALPPLAIALSQGLLRALSPPEPLDEGAPLVAATRTRSPEAPVQPQPRTLELLLDVELPVSISFGKTQLPVRDVLKLTTGSIVELNRGVNEPVEVMVNHYLIARGEVVVVDGNYGVRIQKIASRLDRLKTLQ
jgi:flagellar motor switch protein FliN/FliY